MLTAALLAWGLAPPGLAPGWTGRAREACGPTTGTRATLERMERGYYESLTGAGRRLDQAGLARPEPAATDFGPLTRPVADVREYVLKANVSTRHRGGDLDDQRPGDARP